MRMSLPLILLLLVPVCGWAQGKEGRKNVERKPTTSTPVYRPQAPAVDTVAEDTIKDELEAPAPEPEKPRTPVVINPRELTGLVLDAKTQKPLGDVLIKVKKTPLAVFTNSYGVYDIELTQDLPAILEIKHPGYKPFVITISEPGKVQRLQLQPK